MIICLITSDLVGKCTLPSYNCGIGCLEKEEKNKIKQSKRVLSDFCSEYPEPRSALDCKFKVNIKQLQHTEIFSNECLPLSLNPNNTSRATAMFLMNSFYFIVKVVPTVFIPHITWSG